jgi:hypothetical protein
MLKGASSEPQGSESQNSESKEKKLKCDPGSSVGSSKMLVSGDGQVPPKTEPFSFPESVLLICFVHKHGVLDGPKNEDGTDNWTLVVNDFIRCYPNRASADIRTRIQTRWTYLWTRYKEIADGRETGTGAGTPTWDYWREMHSRFSEHHRAQPPYTFETTLLGGVVEKTPSKKIVTNIFSPTDSKHSSDEVPVSNLEDESDDLKVESSKDQNDEGKILLRNWSAGSAQRRREREIKHEERLLDLIQQSNDAMVNFQKKREIVMDYKNELLKLKLEAKRRKYAALSQGGVASVSSSSGPFSLTVHNITQNVGLPGSASNSESAAPGIQGSMYDENLPNSARRHSHSRSSAGGVTAQDRPLLQAHNSVSVQILDSGSSNQAKTTIASAGPASIAIEVASSSEDEDDLLGVDTRAHTDVGSAISPSLSSASSSNVPQPSVPCSSAPAQNHDPAPDKPRRSTRQKPVSATTDL